MQRRDFLKSTVAVAVAAELRMGKAKVGAEIKVTRPFTSGRNLMCIGDSNSALAPSIRNIDLTKRSMFQL
jgi:hypothetical protein